MSTKAFFINSIVDEREACLPINDLSILRGYGAFDFFRTVNNRPLFLEDYLDRFFRSIEGLKLNPSYSRNDIRQIINDLIEQNNMPVSGIRMIMTGGFSADGYTPGKANLLITQQPLNMSLFDKKRQGLNVITYPFQRILPKVKCTDYLMGVWLQELIKEKGANDVLYFHDNIVSEFPRSNVFIVNDAGQVITNNQHILEGITRKKVLQLAGQRYQVIIRPITVNEVKSAAEVFMTSTTKRLLPIIRVDDVTIGNGKAGPITSTLYDDFLLLEKQAAG